MPIRSLPVGVMLLMEAHHVDPALGEEAGMAGEVLVERPVVDRPEAGGRAVGEGEVVAVLGARDETVLAGELLVEARAGRAVPWD